MYFHSGRFGAVAGTIRDLKVFIFLVLDDSINAALRNRDRRFPVLCVWCVHTGSGNICHHGKHGHIGKAIKGRRHLFRPHCHYCSRYGLGEWSGGEVGFLVTGLE